MRLVTASLSLAAVVCLAATAAAQDEPAPAKDEAAPKKTPLVLPEIEYGFLGHDVDLQPNGRIVIYYRVDSVSPAIVKEELDRWMKGADDKPLGTVDPVGPLIPASIAAGARNARNVLRIEIDEDHLPLVERVLAIIDRPQPQVYVEAKVVEVTFDDQLRVGIEDANIRTDEPVGDLFFKRLDAQFPSNFGGSNVSRLTLGSADKFVKFDYILQMGITGARTEVLSQPSILASQGEEAKIRLGDEEPIVKQNLAGNNVTASTEFKPTGVELVVTPLFIGRDHVRAKVAPEVSRVTEFRITSTASDRDVVNPVISTRSASTVVEVPDGETLVISGLIQKGTLSERGGLPLLRDAPLVGPIFGSTFEREFNVELVFFVTLRIHKPGDTRVITPPAEAQRVYDREKAAESPDE